MARVDDDVVYATTRRPSVPSSLNATAAMAPPSSSTSRGAKSRTRGSGRMKKKGGWVTPSKQGNRTHGSHRPSDAQTALPVLPDTSRPRPSRLRSCSMRDAQSRRVASRRLWPDGRQLQEQQRKEAGHTHAYNRADNDARRRPTPPKREQRRGRRQKEEETVRAKLRIVFFFFFSPSTSRGHSVWGGQNRRCGCRRRPRIRRERAGPRQKRRRRRRLRSPSSRGRRAASLRRPRKGLDGAARRGPPEPREDKPIRRTRRRQAVYDAAKCSNKPGEEKTAPQVSGSDPREERALHVRTDAVDRHTPPRPATYDEAAGDAARVVDRHNSRRNIQRSKRRHHHQNGGGGRRRGIRVPAFRDLGAREGCAAKTNARRRRRRRPFTREREMERRRNPNKQEKRNNRPPPTLTSPTDRNCCYLGARDRRVQQHA
ncbi:hypothetical protein HPB50_016448 [Hyalomma asiaticum]|uniref:Uncharacterized protein n=1 Tax=Hyalomma asiaticum TaxID=266040 RepID=A0ACB7SNF1_HYAAI|nr:hypothetical protein HPB50_016448 [Hyalomma asiaticum]